MTRLDKNYAIFIIGLPGTGKSTLAKMLSDKLMCFYCASDVIHSELFGEAEIYRDRDYSSNELAIIYRGINYVVKIQCQNRKNMIIEGVFRSSKMRNEVLATLAQANYHVIRLYLLCQDDIAVKRVSDRKLKGTASPAGTDGYWRIKATFVPPDEKDGYDIIDGSSNFEYKVKEIVKSLEVYSKSETQAQSN